MNEEETEQALTSDKQPLDAKVLRQIETAISKSPFAGQGKKLKVTPKVRPSRLPARPKTITKQLTL